MRLDDDWMDDYSDDCARRAVAPGGRTAAHDREMRFLEYALNLWLAALVVICALIALGVKGPKPATRNQKPETYTYT